MKFKKPKFWDQKKPSLLSNFLLPFTFPLKLNNLIIEKYKKVKFNKIKSICIGNIYIGGTGKTPLAIKLFNIINKFNNKTIIAKKFYSSHHDEILLLKKYSRSILGQNRIQLIKKAIKKSYKIIIFDDGLQEKQIDYDLKFVCFDSSKWIGNGRLLPSGPLRQDIKILKKIDAIFLKNLKKNKNKKITKFIKSINPTPNIFNYSVKIINKKEFNLKKTYFAVSGIGNPDSFNNLLKFNNFKIIKSITFPDHHKYKEHELKNLIENAKKYKSLIITTEKDYVRIPKKFSNFFKYLKIDIEIENQNKLIEYLKYELNE